MLDLTDWACFASLAAAVQRRGMSIARVHRRRAQPALRLFDGFYDRLVFGPGSPHLVLSPGQSAMSLPQTLLAAPTIDVQGPEEIVEEVRRHRDWPASAAASRVPDGESVAYLFDKLAMTRFAHDQGLAVPRSWGGAAQDQLPVVVKKRIASGGQGVILARTAADVGRAVDALGPEEMIFYQEFVSGVMINFGGVARDGRVLAGAAYESVPAVGDPFGPSEDVRLVSRPDLEAGVRQLISSLSYTGFFCVDFMESAGGPALMIDFNPRVFGGWLALQQSGVPLLEAYLSLFDLAPEPVPGMIRIGQVRSTRIFPAPAPHSWLDWGNQLRHSARAIKDSAPYAGPRFVAAAVIRTALLLARNAVRVARRQ